MDSQESRRVVAGRGRYDKRRSTHTLTAAGRVPDAELRARRSLDGESASTILDWEE